MKVVYLDTQDFVRTLPEGINASDKVALTKLLSLRDQGRIGLGYSALHLFEFITRPGEGYELDRIARGEHVRNLCGKNAFPYFYDLQSGLTYPNDGYWIFSKGNSPISLRPIFQKMERQLKERIRREANLSRANRRKLAKTLDIKTYMVANGVHYRPTRQDFGRLPVTQEFLDSNVIDRLLRGEITFREAELALLDWFCDPAAFSRIVFEYADSPGIVEQYFGPGIEKMHAAIEAYTRHVPALRNFNMKVRKLRSKIGELEASSHLLETVKEVRIERSLPKDAVAKIAGALGQERVGHFEVYFRHIIKSPESFRRSDMMDLLHMCYAYDVDLFRCYKKMFEIFREYIPFRGKLVRSFDELT
jgi:hypothetical protein